MNTSMSPTGERYANAIVKGVPEQPKYKDLQIVTQLRENVFLVKLAFSDLEYKIFEMKIYPFEKGNLSRGYKRECRLGSINHTHIVNILETHMQRDCKVEGNTEYFSYMLFEIGIYGNFAQILSTYKIGKDETLVRTYFHQLFYAIEYLHDNGICHLNIKPENLLLTENYVLKITNFTSSRHDEDNEPFMVKGTKNYRPPEIKNGKCQNTRAADVYSLGITLFTLKTAMVPYHEEEIIKDTDLNYILMDQANYFIQSFRKCRQSDFDLPDDFKELFFGMVKKNPNERLTLDQIRETKWFQGPIYDEDALIHVMSKKGFNIAPIYK